MFWNQNFEPVSSSHFNITHENHKYPKNAKNACADALHTALKGWGGSEFFFDLGKTNKAILFLWLNRVLSNLVPIKFQHFWPEKGHILWEIHQNAVFPYEISRHIENTIFATKIENTITEIATMVTDWESTKPHLCSKLSIFKMSWQILEVQPQLISLDSSLPYLRIFQWGTLWPCVSRGIKNTTSQSWKFKFIK